MVQIESAANQVAVGASDVDSQAITEEAISSPDELPDDAGQPVSSFTEPEATEESERPGETTTIPPQWQSHSTHRSRQIALVVAVSVSGLLTAALFFGWFVKQWNQPSVAQTDPTESLDNRSEAEQQVESVETPPQETDQATSDPPPDPPDDPTDQQQTDQASVPEATAESTSTQDTDETTAEPSVPSDLLPQSPIVNPVAEDPPDPPADDVGTMTKIPDGLAEFADVLVPFGPVDLQPTGKAPPTLEEVEIDAAAQDQFDPAPGINPPQKINVKADFSIQFALDSKGYRLADLVLIFSQMTGVPVQIDWVSFDLAGVDVHQVVQTPKTKLTSAMQLLELVAGSLSAEVQVKERMLVLTPNDARFDAKLAEVIRLDDFGGNRQQAVGTLNEFLHGQQHSGAADLQVGDSREEKQFAVLAVDSLRRMQGLSPQVPDDLFGHWGQTTEDRSIAWPELTGGDAGPQRITPISVAGLIRRTAKRNDASSVVQWNDAVRRRLSPVRILIPHAGEDAASMMHRVLSDFDLQVRQVDSKRWWIGAPSTYDRAPIVVWTKPLGVGADSFKKRVASVMTERDAFRITIDPVSDRALMLLPRYVAEQLPKIEASVAAK